MPVGDRLELGADDRAHLCVELGCRAAEESALGEEDLVARERRVHRHRGAVANQRDVLEVLVMVAQHLRDLLRLREHAAGAVDVEDDDVAPYARPLQRLLEHVGVDLVTEHAVHRHDLVEELLLRGTPSVPGCCRCEDAAGQCQPEIVHRIAPRGPSRASSAHIIRDSQRSGQADRGHFLMVATARPCLYMGEVHASRAAKTH